MTRTVAKPDVAAVSHLVVSAVIIALAAAATTACGGPTSATSPSSSAVTLIPGRPSVPVQVPARANIFGAGHDAPPDPGGGGPGVLPPVVHLPAGGDRVLRFPAVAGKVNPIVKAVGGPGADFVGPAGDGGRFGTTDVESFGGISGVIHRGNGMFLVGVLLTDRPPQVAPERLDLTAGPSSEVSNPEIGQTFLVGDGRGVAVRVPDGATRLFLGFADGYLYRGLPGWYDNNEGQLTVTVQLDT